jgi:hypothetical protein
MNKSNEVFTNLEDVKNITEEDKHFLKVISKKVIEFAENAKGKAAKTRIRLDEDSDQEYELVRKSKRRHSDPKPDDPVNRWYNSIRYYFKKVHVVISNGDPYLTTLTNREKKALIKDSMLLSQKLLDFASKLKEFENQGDTILRVQFTLQPPVNKDKTNSI